MVKTVVKRLLLLFFSVMLLMAFALPKDIIVAKTTQELLNEAQQQHENTKKELEETQQNIKELNNVKSGLMQELDKLNEELTMVSNNLAELEEKISVKEKEIEQTEADLELAIATEEAQYEAMKKRVKYMYERKDAMMFEVLFSSGSFSEFLNRSDYIEQLSRYDTRTLYEYQATRAAVEEMKALLEKEKAELDEYHEEVVAEQAKVAGYVKSTSNTIGKYSNQIKDAEALANEKAAKAAEEEKNIAALKKKLEEELALSRRASQSVWRNISDVQFQEGDRYLLANLIYCEAGNQPYEGQLAVGAVVINRVLSSVFPNTVVGVIYSPRQFSPVSDGHLALALAANKATAACYKAADEAMAGKSNVGNCVFFRTPIPGLTGIQIGAHIFY